MTPVETRRASFAASLGLHLLLVVVLTLSVSVSSPSFNAPPAMAELWSAPPMTRMRAPEPVALSRPEPVPEAESTPLPEVAKPDIALKKPEPKPEKKPEPKPEPKPEKKPEKKPEPEPKPEPKKAEKKAESKPVAKNDVPAKPVSKNARPGDFDVDDALADLGSTNTRIPPNSTRTQAGSKDGVPNGVAGGVGAGSGSGGKGYESLVISRVRPLVQVPSDLAGNPTAVVRVTLLPSLEVREVKLLQSSGNAQYDEAVQRAVLAAKTFPALLSGMKFSDVRVMTLKFRPR